MRRMWLLGSLVLVACDALVVIGSPTDAGAPDASTGGGGGGGGAGEDLSCPGAQVCGDAFALFAGACMDLTRADSVPVGSASCAQRTDCDPGSLCYPRADGGVCLRQCVPTQGAGGGGGNGGGGGTTPPVLSPWVGTTGIIDALQQPLLTLPFPPNQAGDFLIAVLNVDEGAGQRTFATPASWTLLTGWPIHNISARYPTYNVPASQNQGTWVFTHFVVQGELEKVSFVADLPTTARGAIVAYRGVEPMRPIHDDLHYPLFGASSNFGSGSTTLLDGREVHFVTTAPTTEPTRTASPTGARVNSGLQPEGLNLVIYDSTVYPNHVQSTGVENFDAIGAPIPVMFTIGALVLTPTP